MIIAHEWEGEPGRSVQVKKLYRPNEPLIEYFWDGEDHDSESFKKVNGVETIRNLIPNPSFEHKAPDPYGSEHLIDHTDELSSHGGYSARAFQGWQNVGHNRIGVKWNVNSKEGYIGVRIKAYIPSTTKFETSRLNFQLNLSGPQWQDVNPPRDEWVEYTHIFESVTAPEASFWIGFATDGNQEGDEVYFDEAIMVHGYSELEVTNKLDEGYFDGDTRHDHGTIVDVNYYSRGLIDPIYTYQSNNSLLYPRTLGIDDIGHWVSGFKPESPEELYLSLYIRQTWSALRGSGIPEDLYLEDLEHTQFKEVMCLVPLRVRYSQTYIDLEPGVWTRIEHHVEAGGSVRPLGITVSEGQGRSSDTKLYIRNWGIQLGLRKSEELFTANSKDIQIPNTKVYYDDKWVSLYDYHSS